MKSKKRVSRFNKYEIKILETLLIDEIEFDKVKENEKEFLKVLLNKVRERIK